MTFDQDMHKPDGHSGILSGVDVGEGHDRQSSMHLLMVLHELAVSFDVGQERSVMEPCLP